ncbi:ABC transporter permease subunit [Natronolimnobius baerhuensis]|uniref:ABC transporter n=1 Tax=Natronolimnobius baerhuensis TaxID=253108 RepID=A0A202EAP1_9EURY|nr:ABC transporter permease subunit [Natronolimnobius baerhuensis]OVE85304.1 hypothetical protein B2G88_00285 [Natronolimnobius baerhuensis]
MTRGWRLIARKEIGDAIRNRQLYSNAAMFIILFGLVTYFHVGQAREGFADPVDLVEFLNLFAIMLVPAVGLMLSYAAIVKRREDGQLTLLLGLPHNRRDVVIGTYLGRFVILTLALAAGTITAAILALVFGVELATTELLGFTVLASALGLAYIAIAICLSMLTRDQTWASIAAFCTFLLFVLAWRFVPEVTTYIVYGFEMPAQQPWWHDYVGTLSPSVAYERALEFVIGEEFDQRLSAFGIFVLAGWAVLAPAAGYLQFKTSDL